MTSHAALAAALIELLELEHQPVAVAFARQRPNGREEVSSQPAGCCFWEPATRARLVTTAEDHAGCSVGSYVHGFVTLQEAAGAADVDALVTTGWVTPQDLAAAPSVGFAPGAITYEPLAGATTADVVLLRLTPRSVMTLQSACPGLELVAKPQCQIVALAHSGQAVVSPGCAVSRARTGLPAGELTCALPATDAGAIAERLAYTAAADRAAAELA